MIRTAEWGNWAINFVLEAVVVASVNFPVGAHGPCDGFVGSPERERYQRWIHDWMTDGSLPGVATRRAAWMRQDTDGPAHGRRGNAWPAPGDGWLFQPDGDANVYACLAHDLAFALHEISPQPEPQPEAIGNFATRLRAARGGYAVDAEHGSARFPDPAICDGCGYPLTNHPRMGCAFIDGHKS